MGRGKHLSGIIKGWVAEQDKLAFAEIEARDPMPREGGPALWAWYKRQNRAHLRRMGYIRMDVQMPPWVYEKLKPHLMPYCGWFNHPRGSELVRFLADLEITED